jgi:hypothetical protein
VSVSDIEDTTDAATAHMRAAAALLERLRQAADTVLPRQHAELLGYVQRLHDLARDIESLGNALTAEDDTYR